MRDFWAAIGACCLSSDCHKEMFDRCKAPEDLNQLEFTELKELRLYLKQRGFVLNRQAVLDLNLVLRYRYKSGPPADRQVFQKLREDEAVLDIRKCFAIENLQFPGDLDICAIVGLCCIDSSFRSLLKVVTTGAAGDVQALRELLVEPNDNLNVPSFPGLSSSADLERVDKMLRSYHDGKPIFDYMKEMEAQAWFQDATDASSGACTTGFGDKPFRFLLQQEVIFQALRDPNVFAAWNTLSPIRNQAQFLRFASHGRGPLGPLVPTASAGAEDEGTPPPS